jgi:hypothetical protein
MPPIIILYGRPIIDLALIGKQDDSNECQDEGKVVHLPILFATEQRMPESTPEMRRHSCQSSARFV